MIQYNQGGVKVRFSEKSDAEYLGKNMCETDRREVWASNHLTGQEAAKLSFKKSFVRFTVENGFPIAMFGLNAPNLCGSSAIIWMLSTDDLSKFGYRFAKRAKEYVDYLLGFYPLLENYVHCENKPSIKWLESLGAEFDKPERYGAEGELT
jgi:hypothetical protein